MLGNVLFLFLLPFFASVLVPLVLLVVAATVAAVVAVAGAVR